MNLDVAIKDANIYDGLGNQPFIGNIGVSKGRIIFPVSEDELNTAEQVIDAEGLALCPGFINLHSHSDTALLVDGSVPSVISQGITTEVIGNCGFSPAPLEGEALHEFENEFKREFGRETTWKDYSGYFAELEKSGISINVAGLVGHGNLRGSYGDLSDRLLTEDEMAKIKEELAVALKQGAVGLSTGLIYPPGCFSWTAEIVEIAEAAAEYGGYYSTHIRGEGDSVIAAIEEAIKIGFDAKIPVEISHLKASGEKNWGKTKDVLNLIHKARANGQFIQHDQYPYTASCTGLSMILPEWTFDGGVEAMIERLKNPAVRQEIIDDVSGHDYVGCKKILICSVHKPENKKYEGKELAVLAAEAGKSELDFAIDLLIDEEGSVGAIYFSMSEEDVTRVMQDPFTCAGTDASARSPEGLLNTDTPHPRAYGTFPRILGHYCKRMNLFTMEEAIRKMTSLPAKMLGCTDRGIIRHGYAADIVVFDPERIIDTATYSEPHNLPVGIEYVLVNGVIAVEKNRITSARPGKILRNYRIAKREGI